MPSRAVTALTHFHSLGNIKSINKMPIAKMASSIMGSMTRKSVGGMFGTSYSLSILRRSS